MKASITLYTDAHKLHHNLYKAAQRKLEATGAQHVVYGVSRNAKGQLSTFFIPVNDQGLEAYDMAVYPAYVYAVHRPTAFGL